MMNRVYLLLGLWLVSQASLRGAELQDQPRLRRPIALSLSEDEQTLLVANRRSGSISLVDLSLGRVTQELDVARQFSDLRPAGGNDFLATDEAGHELLWLQLQAGELRVRQRLAVAPYPVTVAVSPSRQIVVASLWSRRLTFVSWPGTPQGVLEVTGHLDLPFAPRCQLFVSGGEQLIVADAFGGRLGIIDPVQRELKFVRQFPSHNIRGLGVSPNGKMLVIAHQMLNELAHSINNDVHWGLLMSNDLRWLQLDAVLREGSDLYAGAHMHPLGHAGNATADPAGLAVAGDGTVVVTMGGVGEIASGRENDFSLYRLEVGRRPTAVIISRDSRRALVANTLSDSITLVDLPEREVTSTMELGTQPPLELVDKGELLFYDASLSHDGWMSCHSCHTDGHTNGLTNDNFSDSSFGAPKQVLSLLGRQGTAPFAWNAAVPDLATQIRNSIHVTMQASQPPSERTVTALVAYVESLAAPPSLTALRGQQDPAAVERGRQVFHDRGCVKCHAPPVYTTPQTYDVGLEDQLGNRHFNPPSLLGVGQRGPYFHDNRATTLTDVLQTYSHQLPDALPEDQLGDLLAFLYSL